MFIIITGNPVDGFEFWGPYFTATAAHELASENFRNCDWWVGHVSNPEEVI